MAPLPNFGDSDFEPTDEQLQALSREAFADVAARHSEALARLQAHIRDLQAEALVRLATAVDPADATDPRR